LKAVGAERGLTSCSESLLVSLDFFSRSVPPLGNLGSPHDSHEPPREGEDGRALRAANDARERSCCRLADLDLVRRASARCASSEKGEETHLGVAKQVTELLEELLDNVVVEEEEVVEVEHCRARITSAMMSRASKEEELTLQRQENVETSAPARRVAQKVDELAHERPRELDGELKTSTGDEDTSSRAAKLLRGERREGSAMTLPGAGD